MQNETSTKKKPHLVIVSDVTLYTRNAQRYLKGRVEGVLGLSQFAHVLRQLNKASAQDNPYADWVLWQIHDQLLQASLHLQRVEKRYQTILKTKRNPRRLLSAVRPLRIMLRDVPRHAFLLGDMLGDYDHALSTILTAKFTGLTLDKPFETLEQKLKQIIEPVLNLPNQWKAIDVTREDVTQNNDKAQQARELMGEVPENVLSKKINSSYV
jgi:integrating conjugative element protein (TIGR03761 family)